MIKKILFLMLLGTGLQAQNALNLDFETWSGQSPTGFVGSGISQQTASPNSGSKYARLTSDGNSFPGGKGFMVTNGQGTNLLAGVPCALTPTSVTGYIRTNMAGQDTVYIFGHLRKNFSTILGAFSYSTAQTYTAWQQITIPVYYTNLQTPDTIQIDFIANKALIYQHAPGASGTYLEVDNFKLDTDVATVLPEQSNESNSVQLYPNPASQEIFIKHDHISSGLMEVYSYNGSHVKSIIISNEAQRLDLSEFPAGMYIYRISGEAHATLGTGKFSVIK